MIRYVRTGAGMALCLAVTAAAHAQQNKPIRSGTYYEDQASSITTGSTFQFLSFAQAPTDKFFNVTNVSCDIYAGTGTTLVSMALVVGTTPGTRDVGRALPVRGSGVSTSVGFSNDTAYHLVQNDLFFKIGPGRYPSLLVSGFVAGNAQASINSTCTIIGKLSDD